VTVSFRFVFLILLFPALLVIPAPAARTQQDREIAVSYDLPTLWRSVDAVAYLRIREISVFSPRRQESGFSSAGEEHEASVLEVFRRYRGTPAGSQLKFLRVYATTAQSAGEMIPGEDSLLRVGEECIAFLYWNDKEKIFESFLVLPVRNGQVRSFCIDEILSPIKIEAFLVKLRSMQE